MNFKCYVTTAVVLSVVLAAGGPAVAQQQSRDNTARGQSARPNASNQVYIVRLAEEPVVAYRGGIRGFQATRPNRGQKIDPDSPQVAQYAGYLDSRHDEVLGAVGGRKVYDYRYSFNGFAAELTEEEAARLASEPGVLSVERDELLALDTSSTPTFLGLDQGGLWDRLGAAGKAGEDVIIGIVDGGIWPESLSFSDRTGSNGNASKDGKLDYTQIPGWHGRCVVGEQFTAANCNQKLIGARFYNAGWGGNAGIDKAFSAEFNSPRDFNGHGTHTASTAGGNAYVQATGTAAVFGKVSGIAPRARIAAYKACWGTGSGSCFSSDSVAAIDQAVADGVDVINYSISGSQTNFRDSVEIAFLFAADAGVFVAASAGNSGPAISTVAHPGPWLTTVAAGTHNRNGTGSVTLGNGVTYFGASVATAVTAPLIDSTAAGLPGADASQVALCYGAADAADQVTTVLDPAKVAGKIVVCQRGVTARVNKSLAVQRAGGVGMILFNDPDNSLNADFHFVPTVHVDKDSGVAIKAYATTPGATASIAKATVIYNVPAPFTASFSSRGPLLAGNGDLLKPDVMAPGQDIVAAVAPPGNSGRNFDVYSGTSMSSPHVAGLAALLKNLHPTWSPMMIKSALMTTAYDVLDGGTPAPSNNPVLIFRQGAGHVRPNSAADPGLVFDSGWNDWLGFLCAAQPGGGCAGVKPSDPSDLNVASIAIGDLAGSQTVTRRVTNVGGSRTTYTASVAGLAGFTVAVNPTSLTLNPGQTSAFTVTITRGTAAANVYTGGQLTWTNGTYNVRIPLVVRPAVLAAPAQVSGSYTVKFGYTGPFSATPRGLVEATLTTGSVSDDPTDSTCSLTSPNAQQIATAIAAGTTYARFSLFDADVVAGSDIDLCVFNSAGTLVGSSGSGTSAEQVNLLNPTAGTYTVVVQGWGVVGSSPFTLHTWLLGTANAGNMTVSAPASATLGAIGAIDLTFSGLTPGVKYLGSVSYDGAAGMPNPTIVTVTP